MGKIIVPVDGSKMSLEALKFAIKIAEKTEDELLILNVQSSHEALGLVAIKEAETLLKDYQVKYESKIRLGFPSVEIISEANSSDVKLIVLGKRGAGTTGGNTNKMGSVSNAILELATCPVVIVPKV